MTTATPLAILETRAQVRAYLVVVGEYDLHDAVDGLQAYAERSGLVAELGQDRVQAILAAAFGPVLALEAAA
jgi:hypothetical protein